MIEFLQIKREAHIIQVAYADKKTPQTHLARPLIIPLFIPQQGCPHRCTFCCIQAPFKSGEQALGLKPQVNSYRKWSPATVVDELTGLVENYGVRNVKFADELFVLHRKHVEGICSGIVERGLDLNIWAYARVDSIKDGLLDTLRAAGVRWLALGIEAASERVRNDVTKGFDPALGQKKMPWVLA